jgi:hypothetical protein
MVDIYQMEEKLKQSVIDEIEGQIIKPDEINMSSKGTLDQDQIYVDSVKKTDTFRGGTEFELFTASKFIFPKNENEIMKTMMFGAQTAKQYQSNGQKYQDEMKDNPKLGVKRKTQKSVKHKIEGDKDIEDHVTQWQEFTTIKQGQEQEDPDSKVSVKIHLDTGNKFIVSFVDEHTGYMWIYRMKTKDEMPKVIRKWMIDAYGEQDHNFRHGAGEIEE